VDFHEREMHSSSLEEEGEKLRDLEKWKKVGKKRGERGVNLLLKEVLKRREKEQRTEREGIFSFF